MATYQDVKLVKADYVKTLKKKLNVNGVAVGHKFVAGKDTGELCVTVLVKKKTAKAELLSKDLVPQTVGGIPTDVKEIGEIVAYQARTDRWRPAPGGVSIGHYQITAGTLGAFVRDASTGETLILSNNHVMANSNSAAKGDAIIQPGPYDGGAYPGDRIATLERHVIIQFQGGGGEPGSCSIAKSTSGLLNFLAKIVGSTHRVVTTKVSAVANEVDAAVAKPVDGGVIRGDIIDIGVITGTKAASINLPVRKSGRTTGTTSGMIEMLDATVDVGYGGSLVATFENQIIASAMSSPGDSGSVVVDATLPLAVGLLFAGSDVSTIINPIDRVLELLNIRF